MAWGPGGGGGMGGGMLGGGLGGRPGGSPGNPGNGLPFAGIPSELQDGVDQLLKIEPDHAEPAGDALRRIVRLGDRHQGSEDQQDQAERSHGFIVRVADAGACRFGNFAFHSHP